MKDLEKKTIGQIVADDYRTAEIFRKRGVDFCCHGNRTLEEVCEENNDDQQALISEIEERISRKEEKGDQADYNSWPLDVLADHIEKKHHRYVNEQIPVIKEYLDRICRVHGERHPELLKINEKFQKSAGDLTVHMKKEEFILFPFIRKMTSAGATRERVSPQFGTVRNPIEMMMAEHDAEGARFEDISSLSDGYKVPEDGCNTYRLTYSLLREFQDDLHLHIHLENNILFPKAIQMEKGLLS